MTPTDMNDDAVRASASMLTLRCRAAVGRGATQRHFPSPPPPSAAGGWASGAGIRAGRSGGQERRSLERLPRALHGFEFAHKGGLLRVFTLVPDGRFVGRYLMTFGCPSVTAATRVTRPPHGTPERGLIQQRIGKRRAGRNTTKADSCPCLVTHSVELRFVLFALEL